MSGTSEETNSVEVQDKPEGEPVLTASNLNQFHGALSVAEGVTKWLNSILASFSDPTTICNDAFVAALYVMMYECGFTAREDASVNNLFTYDVKIMRQLKSNFERIQWKNDEIYSVDFVLSSMPNIVKLIAIPMGTVMIVNVLVPNLRVIGVTFKTDDYVKCEHGKIEFYNLKSLSCAFKNVCCTVRDDILHENKLVPTNLQNMPYEILLKICSRFRPNTFANLCFTCRHFYETLFNDEMIWKKFTKKYYNVLQLSCMSWKDYFIDQRRSDRKIMKYMRSCYENYGTYDMSPFSVNGEIIL